MILYTEDGSKDFGQHIFFQALPTSHQMHSLVTISGKHTVRGMRLIFSANRSFLLRKRMSDVLKMIAVTPSKQWIHFFLSERCPPTSTILKVSSLKVNLFSTMPVVMSRDRRMSSTVGMYSRAEMRSRSFSWPCKGKELHSVVGAIRIVKVDLEGGEGADDAGERVNGIVQDEGLVLFAGVQVEASAVDDLHLLDNGAVCESCVGRTQTCGMPTQRLALRLDCLLKPTELGFIAGAPPEEKLWKRAGD
ncbi:hypothetical protein FQN60_008034, partial [Etheostoma spectabile]